MVRIGSKPPVVRPWPKQITPGSRLAIQLNTLVQGQKDSYQVINQFAEGGMAKIFLVKDRLGREHLLKEMSDFSSAGQEIVKAVCKRFVNEATIMANIKPTDPGSQHIVKLIDCDPQPGPTFYIMEKIQGRDLTKSVPEGRTLDPFLALSIMIQILDGLTAFQRSAEQSAAQLGHLIGPSAHRDIKPENILLEIEGRKVKRAVLADFGVAKLPDSDLTTMHEFVGTPGWAAPETILVGGSKQQAGPLSDIFSVGAVLYWLFTGQEPFRAEDISLFAKDPGSFIDQLRQNRPPEISPDMWSVTFRALSPQPAYRFQTAVELRQALYDLYQVK